MNKEITAYKKRFSYEEYCRTDADFWETVNDRVEDLPGEEWRTIPGWCCFEVSNFGRVKRPLQERSYNDGSYPVLFAEKILKPYKDKDGYLQVTLKQFGRRGTFYVHRLVLISFVIKPPTPAHTQVNHRNQNPSDNRLENLQWVTPDENLHYSDRSQRISKGLKKYHSTLSAEEKSERGKRAGMARAKKITCAGVVYESLADFCRKNNVKNCTAWQWLNGGNAMPEEYREKRLSYVTNEESKGNNNETERTTNDIKD